MQTKLVAAVAITMCIGLVVGQTWFSATVDTATKSWKVIPGKDTTNGAAWGFFADEVHLTTAMLTLALICYCVT